MNPKQMTAAMVMMNTWLAHPNELGKTPYRLQCMGVFDHHGLRYYIFRFKKNPFSRWTVGVCGGYEGDSLQSCGHVLSRMQPYQAARAEDDCRKMVDILRAYRTQLGR